MDPKLVDPIKSREGACVAMTFGYITDPTIRSVVGVMPLTETVMDLQTRCTLGMKGVKRETPTVLQGPYDSRPYLPPRPGPPKRYYAVCTLKDLNVNIAAPMTVLFDAKTRRYRSDARSLPMVGLHKAMELSPDLLRMALSAPVPEEGEQEGAETRWLVWGCNRETGHLSWLMLVIEENALIKGRVPVVHNEQVERLARLTDEELDARIMDQPPEKRRQINKVRRC
jgi:hypothetical protein